MYTQGEVDSAKICIRIQVPETGLTPRPALNTAGPLKVTNVPAVSPYINANGLCCSDGNCCNSGFTCTPAPYTFCCPIGTTLWAFGSGSCCNPDEFCLQDSQGEASCWNYDSMDSTTLNGNLFVNSS